MDPFSRENAVVLLFVTTALVLTYGVTVLTDAPSSVQLGLLILVGVVVPQAVNGLLDGPA